MTHLASSRFFQQVYAALPKTILKSIILDKAVIINLPNPINYVVFQNKVLLNALYIKKASDGCEILTDNQLITY